MSIYYKVLGKQGKCCHGGEGAWSLPQDGKPGEWMPKIDQPLVFCSRGYHILTFNQLIYWLGSTIWEVEIKKPVLKDETKCLTQQARVIRQVTAWNEKNSKVICC